MKKIILLFLLLLATAQAETIFNKFLHEQIRNSSTVIDVNASSAEQTKILEKRYAGYSKFLDLIILNRRLVNEHLHDYSKDIFYLQQKITINKRQGNNYSVLRDEIESANLKVERLTQLMFVGVVAASYEKTQENFEASLKEILASNHSDVKKINLDFIQRLEKANPSSKIIIEAKEKVNRLNTLIDINDDLRKYINAYKKAIYQSSLYASFGFNSVAKYISESSLGIFLDPILKHIGINSSKLILIFIIILITLSASKIFYTIINLIVDRWNYKVNEIQLILRNIRNVIRLMITLFGIELILSIFLGIGKGAEYSSKFIDMSYVALITYLIYKIVNTIAILKVQSIHKHTEAYRNEVINLGIKGMNFIIFLIGFLFILKVYGVNLTAILSGLGIGSLAVAFAAKDTLANFFGSISILLDNPFSQGDMIEIDGKVGTVIEIGLRSTTIRTFENGMVTIPNLTIANSAIENWSKRKLGRRIKMEIGVTYESDFTNIRQAVQDIEQMLQVHPMIASEKTAYNDESKSLKLLSKEDQVGIKRLLHVHLNNFSASSIDILVYCFSKSIDWGDWLEAKEDVMYKIANILQDNNLSFAYPALAIHMVNEEEEEEA
jgi:MscS family membrane protein